MKYIVLAVVLAMDAFAVSISGGIAIKCMSIRYALRIGMFFGGFQAIMPLIGWYLGSFARDYVATYDHWIAFILLSLIGIKMIYEGIMPKETEKASCALNLPLLLLLAIATSIDALAVGITFSLLEMDILAPILIIGGITFVISFVGTYIGNSFGHRFDESKLTVIGGIILIILGLKILFEHILAN